MFVADDRDGWRREIRAEVTTDSSVHWRRAGAETGSESLDRFRHLWTDLDALR